MLLIMLFKDFHMLLFRINFKQAICIYVLFESYLRIISKQLKLGAHGVSFYMRRTLELMKPK